MEEKFEEIISQADELQADEEMTVTEFGENKDLILYFHKDCEFNREISEDYSNLVCISTKQNGQFVDDTGDVYVTDGSLYRQLERIYHYRNFQTL
jgi:hypothetical protein